MSKKIMNAQATTSTSLEDQLKAEIAALKAEREALLSKNKAKVTIKMTDKGGVSVYGLGRFPVTLYPKAWRTIISMVDELAKFLDDNAMELARRGEASKAAKKAA